MRGKGVLAAAAAAALWAGAPTAHAATNASVNGAELTVTGSGADDAITVTLPGDAVTAPPTVDTAYEVSDPAGVTANAGCTQATLPDDGDPATPLVPDPNKALCQRGTAPRPAFNDFQVTIDGGGGNDVIRSVAPLTVGDVVSTGDRTFILGGAGDDKISGSENDDVISGGAGNDVIDGDGGNDIISGLTIPLMEDPFLPGLNAADLDFNAGGVATVGAAGNDSIFGGGGSDILTDGDNTTETSDVVSGFKCAPGLVIGAVGCPVTSLANVDVPEEDFDELYWGHRTSAQPVSVDTQLPGATQGVTGENENIIGIRGVYAGAGNDVLKGHDADVGNLLLGGAGNDQLDGRGGNDELLGGDGADIILGGAGGDIINPGGHISSSNATATTIVSDGADTVDGGTEGSDTTGDNSAVTSIKDQITYSGRSDNLTLDLTRTTGWGAAGENDSVTGVEDVTGGHGADVITARAGVAAIIESDPVAPETPHPGEPVLPSPPPGGFYSNDTVHVRNGVTDTVSCGGDATDPDTDSVVADRSPADVLTACENVDLPPIPPPPPAGSGGSSSGGGTTGGGSGGGTGGTTSGAGVTISGARSAGTRTVGRTGNFSLPRHVITCPAGATCTVTTSVSARLSAKSARRAGLSRRASGPTRAYSLGSLRFTVRPSGKAAARTKLSKKGLAALRKLKTVKTTVTVRVVRNGRTTTKTVLATLRAPR